MVVPVVSPHARREGNTADHANHAPMTRKMDLWVMKQSKKNKDSDIRGEQTMSKNGIPLGVVDPDRLYTLEAFKEITSLGKVAMQRARQAGLKVRYVGNKAYVLGADFIKFVEEVGTTQR
jgi:hypothetical protein